MSPTVSSAILTQRTSKIVPLAPRLAIKRAAIPRAGYEYQDLAGIEVLIRHYRDPDLYAWVMLEADDSAFRALDDVVAARKDGSYEFVQVKFTVDTERYELDWEWLLGKSEHGTSMLAKWAKSLARLASMGPIHSAGLKTNRIPSKGFRKCLRSTLIDLDLVSDDIRGLVEAECGSAAEARAFFAVFEFFSAAADLDGFEDGLRDQLVPTDTDPLGWLAFRDCTTLGDFQEPARARWANSPSTRGAAHHQASPAADPSGLCGS